MFTPVLIFNGPESVPRKGLVSFLVLGMCCSTGCLATRDFYNRRTRILENTAYTLAAKQAEFGVSVGGTRASELGAYVGAQYGVSDQVTGRINLLHASTGLIGTDWKWNFFESQHVALAAAAGITWLHTAWIWALPGSIRDKIGDVDAIAVPLDLISSYPIAKWLQLNLGVGYRMGRVVGPMQFSDASIDAGIGLNNLHVDPAVHFFIAERIALVASGEISVWASSPRAINAEATVAEGVRVGVQSADNVYLPPDRLSRGSLAIEMRFSECAYLRAGVTRGAFSKDVANIPLLPFVGFFWRTP